MLRTDAMTKMRQNGKLERASESTRLKRALNQMSFHAMYAKHVSDVAASPSKRSRAGEWDIVEEDFSAKRLRQWLYDDRSRTEARTSGMATASARGG
jgi:hypothetical protein